MKPKLVWPTWSQVISRCCGSAWNPMPIVQVKQKAKPQHIAESTTVRLVCDISWGWNDCPNLQTSMLLKEAVKNYLPSSRQWLRHPKNLEHALVYHQYTSTHDPAFQGLKGSILKSSTCQAPTTQWSHTRCSHVMNVPCLFKIKMFHVPIFHKHP